MGRFVATRATHCNFDIVLPAIAPDSICLRANAIAPTRCARAHTQHIPIRLACRRAPVAITLRRDGTPISRVGGGNFFAWEYFLPHLFKFCAIFIVLAIWQHSLAIPIWPALRIPVRCCIDNALPWDFLPSPITFYTIDYMENFSDPPPPNASEPHFEVGYSVARPQIAKVRYSHDAMIDVLLSNPAISQNQLANHFGYSASWICTIIASDAFKARLAERRAEVVDPALTLTLEEKYKALAEVSVEKLLNYMTSTPQPSPEILVKAAALGAKAAGVGTQEPKIVISSEERLRDLSDRLTGLLNNKREGIIDVQVNEIKDSAQSPGSGSPSDGSDLPSS